MLIKFVLIFCLIAVFFQDMKYRAIYWITFPVLAALLLINLYGQLPMAGFAGNSAFNLSFLLFQLLALTLWLSFKAGRLVIVTNGYLGWGDVFFLCCLALYLSPAVFLLFYLFSLFLILLVITGLTLNRKPAQKIPLAGLQALLLIPVLIVLPNAYDTPDFIYSLVTFFNFR